MGCRLPASYRHIVAHCGGALAADAAAAQVAAAQHRLGPPQALMVPAKQRERRAAGAGERLHARRGAETGFAQHTELARLGGGRRSGKQRKG